MNFTLYKEMLSIRPVRRLLIVGMIARIPHSAAGVLLTLHTLTTAQPVDPEWETCLLLTP